MGNSATGGYIPPSGGAAYDQELEDIFQAFIVGVTSLQGQYVRPRWQEDPPPMPAVGVDWCGFAVKALTSDDGPMFEQHDEDMDSIRHETLKLFLSCNLKKYSNRLFAIYPKNRMHNKYICLIFRQKYE